jgi:hypothetical protein
MWTVQKFFFADTMTAHIVQASHDRDWGPVNPSEDHDHPIRDQRILSVAAAGGRQAG